MTTTIERKLRVLVVDNDRDSADTLGMVVKLWGHEVSVAYSGGCAMEQAPAFYPDVALLD